MTKNRSMKIAVLVLALALLTSCFVGSTFAKYTSSANGSDTVTVAKWSFKVNTTTDIATTETFTFDLFNTVTDDEEVTTEDDDANVKNGVIAPGTGGKFAISLTNASEVAAQYTITLSDGDADEGTVFNGVPLEFSTDGSVWKSIDAFTIAPKTLSYEGNGTDNGGEAAAHTDNVTVYWRWAFIEEKENDLAGKTVIVKAVIDAVQVD